MPHISKKRVKKEVAEELAHHLLTFLSTAKSKQEASMLANELLSQTERVMLAKRLTIVILLAKGYGFLPIEQALEVTPQTVVRMWRELKKGRYEHVVAYARGKRPQEKTFMDELVELMHFMGPPRAGRDRAKWFRK